MGWGGDGDVVQQGGKGGRVRDRGESWPVGVSIDYFVSGSLGVGDWPIVFGRAGPVMIIYGRL